MITSTLAPGFLLLLSVQLTFDYGTANRIISREQVAEILRNMGHLKVDLPPGKLIFTAAPKCGPGFEFDAQSNYCVDINECARGTHNCSHVALCVNHAGSFECANIGHRRRQCSNGFKYNWHLDECIEIDECYSNPCDRDHVCINELGGFKCLKRTDAKCPQGYQFRPRRGCLDIDECSRFNLCEDDEQCVNLQGSYMCINPCRRGFLMIPFQWECIDIDECQEETDNCARKGEECVNTHGGYYCEKTGS